MSTAPLLTYPTPETETPRARLLAIGPEALTIAELLSLLTGDEPATCAPFASLGVRGLAQLTAPQLTARGLTTAKAVRVAAALELGRRAVLESDPGKPRLDAPEAVAAYLTPRHSNHQHEVFGILALDSKHRLLGEKICATGGRHSVAVTPADVYQAALQFRPRSIVAFHNHPSGDPLPSEEDKALTYRLARAGEVLGIALVDHIVLGGASFASFRQLGLLDAPAPAPAPPLRSTERTAAGLQTLAPWAPAIMDTTSRLRTRGTTDVPMPLFTQDEDAAARAEASRQTTLFGDFAE